MNRLKKIGEWIVYGFAIFGAAVFILGWLSMLCKQNESVDRESTRPKLARVEFKVPQLNWQAADKALTKRLDDWNEGLRFRNDTLPVWQPTMPAPEYQLSPPREPVWQPLPPHIICY